MVGLLQEDFLHRQSIIIGISLKMVDPYFQQLHQKSLIQIPWFVIGWQCKKICPNSTDQLNSYLKRVLWTLIEGSLTLGLILKCREELLELKVCRVGCQEMSNMTSLFIWKFSLFIIAYLLNLSSFSNFWDPIIQFLQGIGEKMAEYIIELREESPLKSVSIKIIYNLQYRYN